MIGYPADAPMPGEAAPLLLNLVERGIIRVLDVLFVMQNEDGTVSGVGDFKIFSGASSGLLGEEDVATAAEALEPGTAAVLIVYENRWAAPFAAAATACRRPGREIEGPRRPERTGSLD